MVGRQSAPKNEADYTSPGAQEFANLNRPIPMAEIPEKSGGLAKFDLKRVTVASDAASSEEVLRTPETGLDLKSVERRYSLDLSDQFSGDKAQVAKTAGLNIRTLYRRLKALDID